MKYYINVILCIFLLSRCGNTTNKREYEDLCVKMPEELFDHFLQEKELTRGQYIVFFRVFKKEELFEVWTKKQNEDFVLSVSFPFCKNSGVLGPKRKEGDFQIPEGIYSIDRYNPKSKFHLSLGINYPNSVDLIHADQNKPGGDIFIHGGCASIGCISITNESIDLVYRLAKNSASPYSIEAHFFPFKFNNIDFMNELKAQNPDTKLLWNSLESIYTSFEKNRQLPEVHMSEGEYLLTN
ncbi:MAG: L,D-transpeptidase family protein [Flavobacteriales bacterium]